MKIGFNLKSSAELTPNKRISLPFEALKPGLDFPSLAMEALDGRKSSSNRRLFHLYASLLFSVTTFIDYLRSSG